MSADIEAMLASTQRIAVLGMRESGAAGYVPQYMAAAGYEIVPVNPTVKQVFGIRSLRSLDELDAPVEMVNVFRRSEDVAMHLDEILRAKPKYVWMQLGVRNDKVAERLQAAGIQVVQDRCLMVEHRRLLR